jgi:hypothetical protein
MKRTILASTIAITLVCIGSTASAQEAFTRSKAQVSGNVALGAYMGDGDLNPYGFGLGARAGYTLEPNVYLGGLFNFFFGEEDETTVGVLGVSATARENVNAWVLQGEVGYDIAASSSIVLRPKLGLGVTQFSGEVCVEGPVVGESCEDDSDGEVSFSLGLEAPIDLGGFFISPEARFHFVDDASAFIFAVNLGAAF